MFKLQRGKTEALTVASNIVSWEIVRHMKPFTDGEFIKECMIKVAAQLFPDKPDIQYKELLRLFHFLQGRLHGELICCQATLKISWMRS